METITRKLPQPVTPGEANESYIQKTYTPAQQAAIRLYNGLPKYKRDVLIQDVLNVLGERHKLKLSHKGHTETAPLSNDIVATDDKGNTYILVGSWHDCRFICNGLLKKRKGCRARYFINGQASTGTIQVEHYGEQLQIAYPEIMPILKGLPF